MQKSLSCHHPTVFKLIDQLILANVRVNTKAIKLLNGEEVPLYSNAQNRNLNNNLLNVIGRYNQPDYDINTFLAACSQSHYVQRFE